MSSDGASRHLLIERGCVLRDSTTGIFSRSDRPSVVARFVYFSFRSFLSTLRDAPVTRATVITGAPRCPKATTSCLRLVSRACCSEFSPTVLAERLILASTARPHAKRIIGVRSASLTGRETKFAFSSSYNHVSRPLPPSSHAPVPVPCSCSRVARRAESRNRDRAAIRDSDND